jgi:hypothetical protein
VVVAVGVDVPATRPRRADDHRHPRTEADRQPAHQRLKDGPHVVRAVVGARHRVLGVLVRRDDPAHPENRPGGAIGDEPGEHVLDVVRAERGARVRLPRLHGALDRELLPRRRSRLFRGLVLLVRLRW